MCVCVVSFVVLRLLRLERTNERTNDDDDDDDDADAVFREENGVRRALARVRYALFSALFSRRRRRLERLHALPQPVQGDEPAFARVVVV